MTGALDAEKEKRRIAFDIAYGQLVSQKQDLRFFRSAAAFSSASAGLICNFMFQIFGERAFNLGDDSELISGISIGGLIIVLIITASLAFSALVVIRFQNCTFELNPRWILSFDSAHENSSLLEGLALDADK